METFGSLICQFLPYNFFQQPNSPCDSQHTFYAVPQPLCPCEDNMSKEKKNVFTTPTSSNGWKTGGTRVNAEFALHSEGWRDTSNCLLQEAIQWRGEHTEGMTLIQRAFARMAPTKEARCEQEEPSPAHSPGLVKVCQRYATDKQNTTTARTPWQSGHYNIVPCCIESECEIQRSTPSAFHTEPISSIGKISGYSEGPLSKTPFPPPL